jgi:hypothetical protein
MHQKELDCIKSEGGTNPKQMKITYFGRRINGRFDSFKMFMKRVLNVAFIGGFATAMFFLGAFTWSTSETHATTIQVVQQTTYPVLERIMDCESGTRLPDGSAVKGSATQFRNGQVLINANSNRTSDIGIAQINSAWFKKATELGYDLSTLEGNTKMAEWLYFNKGTGPWSASAKCWNR